MNKNTMIITGVALALLVAGGAYAMSATKKTINVENETSNTNEKKSDSMSDNGLFKGSFFDLLSANKNVRCTFEYDMDEQNASTKGEMYISGSKARGVFKIKTVNTPTEIESDVLSDGKIMYTWMNGVGFKMNLEEIKKASNDINSADPKAKDNLKEFNQKADYKCENWVVDNSKFTVPTDITFSDMTDFIKNAPQMNKNLQEKTSGTAPTTSQGNVPEITCATCDSVPDATAKAECKKALKCP